MSDYYNRFISGAEQASNDLAEKIRQGKGPKTTVPLESGIVKRMQKRIPKPVERQTDAREMMLHYLNGVKSMEKEVAAEDNTMFGGLITPVSSDAVDNPMMVAREALASIESRGSGNYKALGPVVKSGDRAYGRYQVMGNNIGPWTKAVFGKAMSKEEFLNNPKAQDAVVEWKLTQEFKKHGTWEDAASVWFSGRPVAEAGNASDGYKTVPEYIQKFQIAWNALADKEVVDLTPPEEGDQALVKRRKK